MLRYNEAVSFLVLAITQADFCFADIEMTWYLLGEKSGGPRVVSSNILICSALVRRKMWFNLAYLKGLGCIKVIYLSNLLLYITSDDE